MTINKKSPEKNAGFVMPGITYYCWYLNYEQDYCREWVSSTLGRISKQAKCLYITVIHNLLDNY